MSGSGVLQHADYEPRISLNFLAVPQWKLQVWQLCWYGWMRNKQPIALLFCHPWVTTLTLKWSAQISLWMLCVRLTPAKGSHNPRWQGQCRVGFSWGRWGTDWWKPVNFNSRKGGAKWQLIRLPDTNKAEMMTPFQVICELTNTENLTPGLLTIFPGRG